MKSYKAYLIDLDGTMYRGNQVIKEAPAFIQSLRERNLPFLFLTNNSSLTPEQIAEKLNGMGVSCEPAEVYTTSLAAAEYIRRVKPEARRVFTIGETGLIQALQDNQLTVTEEEPEIVVVGIDRKISYEKLACASLAAQKGALFLSTNPDRAIPTERGLVPGNGAITMAISYASGVEPQFVGKPEPLIVELALQKLGCSAEEVLLVGDNLHTDIAAGVRANVDTLLVYTGITTKEDLTGSKILPTYEANHLQEWKFA
ncbi:TIGR01457 family HAD-type hydrolase [Ammoniphilus resinae]|uniref:Acid sugar phosphatase n=1 Tax=Ammoniphilus resinae TaxID=861532 RepID=A0ABS4GWJ6_9BACL|nr:TIGR01457 family HAD-type hydrolase [Ammoniphilus resinae]MBP1934616.1 4-nitrophenyl phosphatase [Ammoniphilus resinae]